ncbi:hypothetical protein TorRG33x02_318080, partial [Trema orientale]
FCLFYLNLYLFLFGLNVVNYSCISFNVSVFNMFVSFVFLLSYFTCFFLLLFCLLVNSVCSSIQSYSAVLPSSFLCTSFFFSLFQLCFKIAYIFGDDAYLFLYHMEQYT